MGRFKIDLIPTVDMEVEVFLPFPFIASHTIFTNLIINISYDAVPRPQASCNAADCPSGSRWSPKYLGLMGNFTCN